MKDKLKKIWEYLSKFNSEWYFGLYFLVIATSIFFTGDMDSTNTLIAFYANLTISFVLNVASKILIKLDDIKPKLDKIETLSK